MELYPHNQRAYESAVTIFENHDRTCIIHPTGTGKAVIIGKFISDRPKNKHLLFAPGYHIYSEVRKHTRNIKFMFRTYHSMKTISKIEELTGFDFIYLDEFHRIGAEIWGPIVIELIRLNPQAKILGTTATHIRFLDDHRDMAFELFKNNIASFISLNKAFLEGILLAPIYISAIYSIEEEHEKLTKKIKTSNYEEKSLLVTELKKKVIDWEKSYGIDTILKKHIPKSRKRIIVFCSDLKEIKTANNLIMPILKEIFDDVVALDIHSKFPKDDNNRNLTCFREKDERTKVLFTVDMMNEGLHGKDISTAILLRETNSPNIFYQQIGRCFSVGQTERPIIIDLVNNFKNVQLQMFKADYDDEVSLNTGIRHEKGMELRKGKKELVAIEFIDETQGIQDLINSFSNMDL